MNTFRVLARIAHDWAERCFGRDHVTNLQIRGIRSVEELVELCQALRIEKDTLHKVIDTVYARPVGDADQEIGGSLLTLFVLCEAMGKDPEELFEREVRRVLKKSPEHFAKRNAEKITLGLDAPNVFAQECTRPAPHVCATNEPCNGLPRIEWRDGERVKADRLWRDPLKRRAFETETNTPCDLADDNPADYNARFNRWAIIQVRQASVPPPGAAS